MRFIVNLPKEELESVERICFQVEEAQWFYEDFVRPLDPNLPSLNLRQFCLLIFQHCPLLSGFSPYHHSAAFSEFLAYKTRVPVRGAIMLNEAMDEVVLVKGWKKNANWSFPRGKINKDEKDIHCAIREVYEETGFDIQKADLVGSEEDAKYIEITMREQHMRLYVFRGVPMDTHFEPRTRKEISKIQWYKLSELPTLKKIKQQQQDGRGEDLAVNANKFYMVAPFLVPLKKWISQQKKVDAMTATKVRKISPAPESAVPYVEGQFEQSEIGDISPIPNDMSRIMTQLRQSGQVGSMSDLPELSVPAEEKADPSAQLKNLLRLPESTDDLGKFSAKEQAENSAKARQQKGNALLSLLRSGGSIDPQQANRLSATSQAPQTPMEQIIGQSRIPLSPRHLSPRLPEVQSHPRSSAFPFSPSQIQGRSVPRTSPPAAPISHHYQTLSDQMHSYPTSFQIHAIPQPSQRAQAPYMRTGDPQFAQVSEPSAYQLPSIPPASKLPPPKLTSHSSALLDLFKSNPGSGNPLTAHSSRLSPIFNLSFSSTANPAQAAVPASMKSGFHPPGPVQRDDHAVLSSMTVPQSSMMQPSAYAKPKSPQKEALLNLFRNSAASTTPTGQIPFASAALPNAPVELSAQHSPSHSRMTSETAEAAKPSLGAKANGPITIQKRPAASTPGLSAVSATVTGPLNNPQFDKILKRPSEAKGKNKEMNGVFRKDSTSPKPQMVPVTILPRPTSSHHMVEKAKPKKQRILENDRHDGVGSMPLSPKIKAESRFSPKPFHPQILQRPIKQESPYQATSTKYETAAPVVGNGIALHQSPRQTQEHKSNLLSLFNKTSPMMPTSIQTQAPISPISGRFPRQVSFLPSPLEPPRSRLGSLNSISGDGKLSSGKQTPKPSPVDKQFLLGFLDQVAKQGR